MLFSELIEARRSVRDYEEGSFISNDDIKKIIEAAQLAPSWKNSQTARYYVANTAESAEKLSEALPEFNKVRTKNAAYIITTFVKDISGFTAGTAENELSNKWGAYDLGLANAYLLLAAKDMGYDTLIMGMRDAAKLRAEFNIPKTEQITSVIAIGKGKEAGSIKTRNDVDEIVKFL